MAGIGCAWKAHVKGWGMSVRAMAFLLHLAPFCSRTEPPVRSSFLTPAIIRHRSGKSSGIVSTGSSIIEFTNSHT